MGVEEIERQNGPFPGEDPADTPTDDEASEPSTARHVEELLHVLDEIWPGEHDPDRPSAVSEGDTTGPGRPIAGPGHRQLGKFRILRELGRGGFGIVLLAEDTVLGRKVALKVPRFDFLSHPEVWGRFRREARAASRLDHPNLVPLLEVSGSGAVGYIVSAYVPGPSLDQWVRHRGLQAPQWSARILATLARAVEHIHRQGVLHRDLKPANVLLFSPGVEADPSDPSTWEAIPVGSWVPRICDFGLAKLRDIDGVETRTRVVCGSPSYMAPEQAEARRGEVGPATDVYGLGAILYKMLTGRPPFTAETDLETLRRVAEDAPIPPRDRRPNVPRDLETICLKCLAKRPERRYPTAADLADDLDRFLDGRVIAARPAPAWERLVSWVGRTPERRILAAACVVAVLTLGVSTIPRSSTVARTGPPPGPGSAEVQGEKEQGGGSRIGPPPIPDPAEDGLQVYRRRQQAARGVRAAQKAAESGNAGIAARLLEEAGPGLGPFGDRGFAWSYVDRLVPGYLPMGHRWPVWRVAADPTGQVIASGDIGGEVRTWDRRTARRHDLHTGTDRTIWHLVFSPDGKALASANRDFGDLRLWDVASGRPLGIPELKTPVQVLRLCFAGRDRRLAAILNWGDRELPEVLTWDPTRPGDRLPIVHAPDPTIEALSRPDPRLQAIADILDERAIDGPGLDELGRSWDGPAPLGLAGTRDRQLLVVGNGDGTFALHRAGASHRLALGRITPTGTFLALFNSSAFAIPLVARQREQIENLAAALFRHPPARPRASDLLYRLEESDPVVMSPGRDEVAIADEARKRLSVVDLATGRQVDALDIPPELGFPGLAFAGGGKGLVIGSSDRLVRIWDRRPDSPSIVLDAHTPAEAWAVALAPDGVTLASAGDDRKVRLWDLRGLPEPRPVTLTAGHRSLVTSLAFSPDGRTLASAGFDGSIILWDVEAKRRRGQVAGRLGRLRCLAFDPSGRYLASGGNNREVVIWKVEDGSEVRRILGHSAWVFALAFSPDGKTLASGGLDARILLTSIPSGQVREIDAKDQVMDLAFTPDGARLITAHDHGAIRIWDPATGAETMTIPGQGVDMFCLAISPDGKNLATGDEGGFVRAWDLATLEQELTLACRGPVRSVAFSPDGRMLSAADHSGAVWLWDARPRDMIERPSIKPAPARDAAP